MLPADSAEVGNRDLMEDLVVWGDQDNMAAPGHDQFHLKYATFDHFAESLEKNPRAPAVGL